MLRFLTTTFVFILAATAPAFSQKQDAEKDIPSVAKETLKSVATKAAMQIPGTSTGGPLPASVTDAAVGLATGVVTGAIIDSAKPAPQEPPTKAKLPCFPGTDTDSMGNCK
jgi:hypothetical protein